jgi:hypothetical protein
MNEIETKATHKGKLKIGNTEIRCFVLEDERRVLSGREVTKAMGLSGRGQGMRRFLDAKSLKPFINRDLEVAINNPVTFLTKTGVKPTIGYEATILADLCDAVLLARKEGILSPNQIHVAEQAEILVRGFARVGIIALVDEATGYEAFRSRKALEKILDEFISKELRKWSKTFPDEFYEEMFRLRNWQYRPFSVKRPSVVGRYTNDLVYSRLAPSVLEELKHKNPKDSKGRRKHKHFQWLTENVGDPRLREHLASVITLMKASSTWKKFYHLLNRALPQYDTTMMIPFLKDEEDN